MGSLGKIVSRITLSHLKSASYSSLELLAVCFTYNVLSSYIFSLEKSEEKKYEKIKREKISTKKSTCFNVWMGIHCTLCVKTHERDIVLVMLVELWSRSLCRSSIEISPTGIVMEEFPSYSLSDLIHKLKLTIHPLYLARGWHEKNVKRYTFVRVRVATEFTFKLWTAVTTIIKFTCPVTMNLTEWARFETSH